MRERFRSLVDALDAANHEAVIKRAVSDFAADMGFERYAFVHTTGGQLETCTNYPHSWLRLYFDKGLSRVDPVIEKAKRLKSAFYWCVDDWDNPIHSEEVRAFGKCARVHGLRSGFTVPVQGSYNRTYMLTLARDGVKPNHPILQDPVALASAVFALHYRLVAVANGAFIFPRTMLSPREAVCLKWSSRGLHAPEIADVLNVGTRTVQDYLDKARAKLKASTVAHAVALGKDQKIL